MKKLHPVMFAGTGSDVGKSVIAAAFCRIFRQDGYRPAPFKAQNMALNSYATPEGLEIGRAQAVQAEAAGIPCHTDMNPLLLKPNSDKICQVVLNGRSIGNQSAGDYFRTEGRDVLRKEVHDAYDRLAARYNPIVMEGAGSISEINLRETDLVNMPMALHAGADVILVADIDRGGVFASVYGSVELLPPEERRLIKGVLINKFRGDIGLFESGVKMMEDLCRVPVIGVVPYFRDIYVEEEDSINLKHKSMHAARGKVNVAVVLLRHMSNFTDFDVLEKDSRVHLFYADAAEDLHRADVIILPGTKSTLADLHDLRRSGMAGAILQAHRAGATVLGICGGYQMMGMEIEDPEHTEGNLERLPGLGLLPVHTSIAGEKVTCQSRFRLSGESADLPPMEGYEIHMGVTRVLDAEERPLVHLTGKGSDGYMVDETCMGTYMHGILDNARFRDFLLERFGKETGGESRIFDYRAFKEEQYERLAAHVRSHVNMDLLYHILGADD